MKEYLNSINSKAQHRLRHVSRHKPNFRIHTDQTRYHSANLRKFVYIVFLHWFKDLLKVKCLLFKNELCQKCLTSVS